LAGSLEDLKNGDIFLEIILHYLKIIKQDEIFLEEFRKVEYLDDFEKYEFLVKTLKIISNDDELFDNFSYEKIVI